ncbi:1-deoxy-D-xylulose-5-phosphate synthase [bacterium]|nr:1-deoxy-D-xylulose-5-phosphate synthase [bacterium]
MTAGENNGAPLLDRVKTPEDLRKLSLDELPELCAEIRREIVGTVSKTGGHLASSLGAVEIAVALHYVYDTPKDKLVWDTGHQAYAHKILTGRREAFHTLRQKNGLSGYPTPEESGYDCYPVGHAGTSVSVALGLAAARDLKGENFQVVSIIGDGALTAGLALEALNNNAARSKFTIVLNDNAMSISPTKGAIAKHFARLVSNVHYRQFKRNCKNILSSIPLVGVHLMNFSMRLLGAFKLLFIVDNIFEKMGFHYIGPVDGNDVKELVRILKARSTEQVMPVVLHCRTKKGKGYAPAEKNPERFHGVGQFDPATGEPAKTVKKYPTYTDAVSKTVLELAEKDERVVVVSAAMCGGTGMTNFANHFPDRFFDVGIAEQHAVTFAGGLASSGLRPVVGIYSTFMQRAYDEIAHDVCLPNANVILALDRAGLVGSDGKTHHGAFDMSYLRHLPNLKIFSPRDEAAVRAVFEYALKHDGPVAVRYPRRTIPYDLPGENVPAFSGDVTKWQTLREGDLCANNATGHMVFHALRAAEIVKEKYAKAVRVIDACAIKPLDAETLTSLADIPVVTLEDNALIGGLSETVAFQFKKPLLSFGIPDDFVSHGTLDELYSDLGWQPEQIAEKIAERLIK